MAVSVIWPKSGQHLVDYENIDGIIVYQHSLPLEARGNAVLLIEYTVAILHEAYLLPKILSRGFVRVRHAKANAAVLRC